MSSSALPSSLDSIMSSRHSFHLIAELSLRVKQILGIPNLILLAIAALAYFMKRAAQAALPPPDYPIAQCERYGSATTTP
jgi:hypothetical protein